MVEILVYAYMNRAFSSREIQRLCQRDIHFIWLLNVQGHAVEYKLEYPSLKRVDIQLNKLYNLDVYFLD